MKKGQASTGLVILVVMATIMVTVIFGFTGEFCNCTPNDSSITFNGTGVNVSGECVGTKCTTGYSLVCNGTTLVPGVDYNIYHNCNLTMLNGTYENSTCTFNYTYEGAYYNQGLLSVIVCNIPILFALGVLVLGVGWAVL